MGRDFKDSIANASLIASAPALLAALKAINPTRLSPAEYAPIQDALAHAEGRG